MKSNQDVTAGKKYLVFDIGCIECSEDSQVVGVYPTKEEAEKAIEDYLEPGATWGKKEWYGQHSVEIFEITKELSDD